MSKVAILGATGYTARELALLLLKHPNAEIVCATTRDENAGTFSDSHPALRGRFDLKLTQYSLERLVDSAVEVVFSCLPHTASAQVIRPLLEQGIKVIDFSADYRLNDSQTFEQWYDVSHPDPERVGTVPYGLPELFRQDISHANLIANPGCFPTSALLPLGPLVKQDLISATDLIVDSKTGVSGGGRTPKPGFHFAECNESIRAYGVGTHRHAPEINQLLERFTHRTPNVTFTAHLAPMERGILSTLYCRPQPNVSHGQIRDCLEEYYRDETFIRLVDTPPSTRQVSHTNFCDIAVSHSTEWVVLTCAIDNLIKGASGAAVQNFNLMCGYEETTALL
ncbi:MAG: N-acetyl-gamma-glutamyl-phosphate reductase [Mariniblastus sp.]|nr:N-acetyl-gamma-glutamyl-phosphate reductase [Mariniblastus sp.]